MTVPPLPPQAELYLRLLKRCLTRELFPDGAMQHSLTGTLAFNPADRAQGLDWPVSAETMVGMRRLDNVQNCILSAIHENVSGDLVETGVWRGGCAILMRAVLQAMDAPHRCVWLADSFEGLPAPDAERWPADRGDTHSDLSPYLAVSLNQVRDNFRRYELLDERVRFLPGWFKDTLPHAPIETIAVLRLDGDMYESTYIALESLYPKVSRGGYIIIDDYGALPNCRAAVEDFRRTCRIFEPILTIDWTGVYWRKYA